MDHRYVNSVNYNEVDKIENEEALDGCTPFHVNVIARHGTRQPTRKRIRQINAFSDKLRRESVKVCTSIGGEKENSLFSAVENCQNESFKWMLDFQSPWQNFTGGGELTIEGEEEHYQLGKRLRQKFPTLFRESYNPKIYNIIATQVPRASASAVAFCIGLFEGTGTLGNARQRAFAIFTETKAVDRRLRFHDLCNAYVQAKKEVERLASKEVDHIYRELSSSLLMRTGLNFTGPEISTLWILCKQQAAVFGDVDKACSLFSDEEIMSLEWADDFVMFNVKGYGHTINYEMGISLLEDVILSMELSIKDQLKVGVANRDRAHKLLSEKARLRFAHAETIIPFICLLGLFQDKVIRNGKIEGKPVFPSLGVKRSWMGSKVSPYAANIALVLYQCKTGVNEDFSVNTANEDIRVLVLQNEKPVLIPGCPVTYCPFESFKSTLTNHSELGPFLHQQSFDDVCGLNPGKMKEKLSNDVELKQEL